MTLQVVTSNVYTSEGVAISVDGVAQVKVARSEDAIRTSSQQFLGKGADEIAQIALQTLEGNQRAVLGTLTVEQIYQDREAFAQRVREVAGPDMANMGLEIVSFTLRDIQDEQGYLEALGRARTAEVRRDAEIGEAEATRDSNIRKAEAEPGLGHRSGSREPCPGGGQVRSGHADRRIRARSFQRPEGGVRPGDKRASRRSRARVSAPGGGGPARRSASRNCRWRSSSAPSRSRSRCKRSPAANGSWTARYGGPPRPSGSDWRPLPLGRRPRPWREPRPTRRRSGCKARAMSARRSAPAGEAARPTRFGRRGWPRPRRCRTRPTPGSSTARRRCSTSCWSHCRK